MAMHRLIAGLAVGVSMALSAAHAQPLRIVAAESVYGDICRQLGGDNVSVVSILTNPDQDPHEFEASPSTARELARARLVVYNGADYDAWMTKLLAASRAPMREAIEVARLVGKKPGDNPHVWYEPRAVSALAKALADALSRIDPAHRDEYMQRNAQFDASMRELAGRIAELRKRHAGAVVTATEPVFGYMAEALGLTMRNDRFQLAVMNGAEPSAKDIAAFEHDLRTGAVRALIFNSQTSGSLAERMRTIATSSGVPVVGVSETEPPGMTYQRWMLTQLEALDQALSRRTR